MKGAHQAPAPLTGQSQVARRGPLYMAMASLLATLTIMGIQAMALGAMFALTPAGTVVLAMAASDSGLLGRVLLLLLAAAAPGPLVMLPTLQLLRPDIKAETLVLAGAIAGAGGAAAVYLALRANAAPLLWLVTALGALAGMGGGKVYAMALRRQ